VYVELERSHGTAENVRDLFERMSKLKMKKKRAHVVFGRWAEWEETMGNEKGAERVRALEQEWMERKQEERAGDKMEE
jgi:rRNA biogenesis protein RRP5